MRRRFINTKSFEKNKIACTLKPAIPMIAQIYGDYFDDSQIASMRINGVLVEKRPRIEVAPNKEYVIEITFGELYSLSCLFFETNVISVSGLETLDTKNVTDMESTFSRVNFNIPNLDMWDISNVQTMRNMFERNSHITSSPFTKLHDVLPSDRCYEGMFDNCSGLIKAPELPAKILTQRCYYRMFYLCSNLNYIKMLATDISANDCLWDWVEGVSSTGTFVKSKDATWDTTPGALGTSGVPAGWTVIDDTFPTNEDGMPESTTFEFPLYFNTQIVEQTDDFLYRSNSGDLIQDYRKFVQENANDFIEWEISERFINDYPVYIDGYRIVSGIYYYGNIENIVTAKDYGNYNELYINIDEVELYVEGYN